MARLSRKRQIIMHALVLAGSRGGIDPVAAYAGVDHKALVEVAGQTVLSRVVGALREAGVETVFVSTSTEAVRRHAETLGATVLPATDGPSASARAGFARAGSPLVLTTADHALLRPEWVTSLMAAEANGGDVTVMLARREAIETDAPITRRTYLRFADGDWSGCNLFLLATPRAERALELWSRLERDRKRPWRIVRRLGMWQLLRYLTRRMSIAEGLRTIGDSIGVDARHVAAPSGRAAIDVDTPGDLDLVRTLAG